MAMPDPRGKTLAGWLNEGVQAHGAGNLVHAKTCYEAALALSPGQHDALHLLGVIADQQGRHAEAVDLIRQAIAVRPQAAQPHGNLGTALLELGDLDGAEAAYRKAVALDPTYLDGHLNLGNLLRRRERHEESVPCYEAALKLAPKNLDVYRSLIAVRLHKRDMESVVELANKALSLDPAAADFYDKAAVALRGLRRFQEAVRYSLKALKLEPDNLDFREHHAAALSKLHSPRALVVATQEYKEVARREPGRLSALMGVTYMMLRRQLPDQALIYAEQCIALAPDRVDALANRSAALMLLGRKEEAMRDAERAIELAPDDYMVRLHRGILREQAGDYEGALEEYRAAQQIGLRQAVDKTEKDADFSLGLLLLSLGRLGEGWPLYRARTQINTADPRGGVFLRLLPDWDGVVRPDQRVLVWAEQGIGDQIIYSQMLPELAARGVKMCCACDQRLIGLFKRSFPDLHIEPAIKGEYDKLKQFGDVQIGFGELGALLRPTLAEFPPARAFLRPDPARVSALRDRYKARGKRFIVGLSWRSKNFYVGEYKTVPLTAWAPILKQDDILFVDLQYGKTEADRAQVLKELGVEIFKDDEIDPLGDLDPYAAQVAAMDLVIGNSNTGVHVAGALGKECLVMLPSGANRLWYWFHDRADSPWYPHMRLFRQPLGPVDNWKTPVAEVAETLQAWRRRPDRGPTDE